MSVATAPSSGKTRYTQVPIRQGAIGVMAAWILLIATSLAWNMWHFQRMIVRLATIEAAANFDKDVLYRRWAAKQGGVYVPVSEQTPANPLLSHVPSRDITTSNGQNLTLVNPAYMTRLVYALAAEGPGVQAHITSINPLRAENRPDPWEQEALLAFAKGAIEVSSLELFKGKPHLRLMRPFFTDESCLKCHGSQGYKKGDIRGGISVSVPMANYYQLRAERFWQLGLWHLIIVISGLTVLVLGSRHLQAKVEENRLMQEALLARQEELSLFRSLIDQAADSLFIVDLASGKFLDINTMAASSLGYQREQLLTMSVMDIDPATPNMALWQIHSREMQRAGSLTMTSQHRRQDGSLIPVEVSIRYLVHNQHDYLVACARDITERQQKAEELKQYQATLEATAASRTQELLTKTADLEKSQQALLLLIEDINTTRKDLEAANTKLQELDRLKSMFIASMSHELRTPLNSIIGFSSILLEEWQGPLTPEQKNNQAIILKNGKHLLALINDIIDISKIEAGILESHSEEFDLGEMIGEAAANFSADIASKGITLTAEPCPYRLHTDRRRLLQCLLNLLGNAVKFTHHGAISIHTQSQDQGRLAILVQDTGIGISEEDQAKLFTPFLRLHSANGKYPGTGLGLYLSRKLLREVLHGDLTVASAPEQGSTFTITIPMQRDAEATAPG